MFEYKDNLHINHSFGFLQNLEFMDRLNECSKLKTMKEAQ